MADDDQETALDRLKARQAQRDAVEQPSAGASKASVVVIDDEKGNLDAISRVLGERYELHTFELAEDALAHVQEAGCADLFITDQRMPQMTGVEFLASLVEQHPYATGIILSGYTERDDLIGAINKSHVFAYVTKPWRPVVLLETIEKALEVSETRRSQFKQNQRLSSLSSKLADLGENSDTADFLAGFDDLEAELEAFVE